MKITYEISANLDHEQIFAMMKESIEEKTGKMLCNIYWEQDDAGEIKCKLIFRNEIEELK